MTQVALQFSRLPKGFIPIAIKKILLFVTAAILVIYMRCNFILKSIQIVRAISFDSWWSMNIHENEMFAVD